MEQVCGSGATDRPRVVVSVRTSVDGRVTLRRDQLLMDEDASRVWRSLSPPSAQALDDARSSQLASLYQPHAVLEGSGSLVTDSARLPRRLALHRLFARGGSRATRPREMVHGGRQPRPSGMAYEGRRRVRPPGARCPRHAPGVPRLSTPGTHFLPRRRRGTRRSRGRPPPDAGSTGCHLCGVDSRRRLNGALLRAGLVDEIQLLILPAAIGGLGTPTLFDGPELADGESPTRLRLPFAHAETDGMLWLRYEVIREATRTPSA
jgi:2,5-diamino-6-(ribosylamino)-4(3H)-pyrimidinone 5'-phosphate reductase